MKKQILRSRQLLVLGVLGLVSAFSVFADELTTSTTSTFHLSCLSPTSCASTSFPGGPLLVASNASPSWAIVRSPASNNNLTSPVLWFAVFVPSQTSALTFSIQNGSSAAVAASLFSSSPWTSGSLYNYLGSGFSQIGGPAAPISAFLSG